MSFENLPAYQGNRDLIKSEHNVHNIVNEVCNAHSHFSADYDLIAKDFWKGNVKKTAARLFDFCKQNMMYRAEPGNYQTTRSPAAILHTAKTFGVDCKHYAGFIAGVLDGLRRAGYPVAWSYRFVSYDIKNKTPSHVFVVVRDGGKELFIDPVLNALDVRNPVYFYSLDKKIKMLERISGIGATRQTLPDGIRPTVLPGSETLKDTGFTPVLVNPVENKTNIIMFIGAAIAIYFLIKSNKRG